MLNTPLYSLGDTLVLTGEDSSSSSGMLYYSYSEFTDIKSDYASVTESYSYYDSEYIEWFFYGAQDGNIVDYVGTTSSENSYDASGRVTSRKWLSTWEYSDYCINSGGSTGDIVYVYANSTGYELDYSIEKYSYVDVSSNGSTYTSESTTLSEYSYSGVAHGHWDCDQRRDVTTSDDNGDGIIDYITYSLTNRTDAGAEYSYETITASYEESGLQSFSSIYAWGNISNEKGHYIYYSNPYASILHGDGISDSSGEQGSIEYYDSEGNLISTSYESIHRYDYDEDGAADWISFSKGGTNESAGKRVEYSWEASGSGKRGTLTIEKSMDFDGDGVFDKSSEKSLSYTPSATYLDMGDHVATIEDTYMTTDTVLA